MLRLFPSGYLNPRPTDHETALPALAVALLSMVMNDTPHDAQKRRIRVTLRPQLVALL